MAHSPMLTASVGTVTNNDDGTWVWSFTTSDGPAETQVVTVTGDDGLDTAQATFQLTVNNVASVATFKNTSGEIQAGGSATLAFSDPIEPSLSDMTAGGIVKLSIIQENRVCEI